MAIRRTSISSCFECAAVMYCYKKKQPDITREEGRARAAQCNSFHKGRVVETIKVVGRERGMSRRNAENLVIAMKAVWVADKTIRLLEGVN